MRLSDLSPLRVKLLAGDAEREFTSVYVTDLPDPGRYLSGGELVLTGLMWWHAPGDSEVFVRRLLAAGVAALGAGQGWLGHVPDDLVTACAAAGLPLIEIPADVSFRAVLDLTARRLAGDVREALGRHRRLVAAVAEGADLPELFAAMGVTGAVISATGTVISATDSAAEISDPASGPASGPAPASPAAPASGTTIAPVSPGAALADPVRLAQAYLTAPRLPYLVSGRTLFAVGRMPRAAGWVLVVDGDFTDRADIGYELASCVALVRRRLDEGRLVERRLLAELLDAPSDARLETCGLPRDGGYCVVSANCSPEVLEELLDRRVVAIAPATPPAPSVAVVSTPDRVAWDAVAARLRSAVAVLSDPPLSVGLSGRLTGAPALRGGLEEAGHARGLAESRSGGVVTSDEIYTHALLLATLPGDVRRSFTGHLLGPLIAYDAAHQSELVRTLEVFLDSAGSWQVCGERMHVHVNTVRYRIRRVEELTGRDLSSMADRVDLYLALRAR
ncbi:PucR family transcriptional regulator [Nonomuraea sp. NPDC050663]|uniref:PucR family transcriptional regulator n=1 Tax=Nonomuraea sp. NPDC050663 TaxID=3364370 RepID=UPI0037B265A7